MERVIKEFLDFLIDAEKDWSAADHIVYVTIPVVKDDKLLIRALDDLYSCILKVVSTILRVEYLFKRVSLSKDSKMNLRIFFEKCAVRYGLNTEDKKVIREIILLGKKHREASVEFSGKGKAFILDEDLGKHVLDIGILKRYVRVSKKLLDSSINRFKNIV